MSGIMTAPLDLSIDLKSGAVVSHSQPFPGNAKQQAWSEAHRTLEPAELKHLLKTVDASLIAGWEAKECLQRDKQDEITRARGLLPPPRALQMDAITSMYMRYRGNTSYSSEIGCRTKALEALWGEAMILSEPRSTAVRTDGS